MTAIRLFNCLTGLIAVSADPTCLKFLLNSLMHKQSKKIAMKYGRKSFLCYFFTLVISMVALIDVDVAKEDLIKAYNKTSGDHAEIFA